MAKQRLFNPAITYSRFVVEVSLYFVAVGTASGPRSGNAHVAPTSLHWHH